MDCWEFSQTVRGGESKRCSMAAWLNLLVHGRHTDNGEFEAVHGVERGELDSVTSRVEERLVQITLDVHLSFFVVLKQTRHPCDVDTPMNTAGNKQFGIWTVDVGEQTCFFFHRTGLSKRLKCAARNSQLSVRLSPRRRVCSSFDVRMVIWDAEQNRTKPSVSARLASCDQWLNGRNGFWWDWILTPAAFVATLWLASAMLKLKNVRCLLPRRFHRETTGVCWVSEGDPRWIGDFGSQSQSSFLEYFCLLGRTSLRCGVWSRRNKEIKVKGIHHRRFWCMETKLWKQGAQNRFLVVGLEKKFTAQILPLHIGMWKNAPSKKMRNNGVKLCALLAAWMLSCWQ